MANFDRRLRVPKNKLKACALCALLCLANLIDVSEAARATAGRVTKPTSNRGYASADIAKLSYSPSHAAPQKPAPIPVASSPVQQSGRPAGWNVPNNAPPPYSAHANQGPPPPYSPQANPNLNSRFNEPPPAYAQSNPGFPPAPAYQGGVSQSAYGASGGVVAGNAYRTHGHNMSTGGFGGGFAPMANAGYPQQPAQGFPGAPVPQHGGGYPGGYPQQPAYQPAPMSGYQPQPAYQPPGGGYPQQSYQPPAGGFQQPGTVVHHYESQPSSGGSGLGTVLGAGVAGLAAGVGGAALYDAFKPKDSKEEQKEAAPVATATEATTSTTLAPINPNGDALLAPLPANPETPLAPMPETSVSPNGEAPLAAMPVVPPNPNGDTPLAPMPAADATTTVPENPLGTAPLAPLPVSENTSATATSSSETVSTAASTMEVEAPNAALSVQPNQAAAVVPTTAPQLSAEPAGGKGPQLQFSSFLLLVPALCKFLIS